MSVVWTSEIHPCNETFWSCRWDDGSPELQVYLAVAPVVMGDSSDGDSLGSPSYATINTFFECKDGVSIGLITVVVLGILTMFYILFTKITQGRRKRDLTGGVSAGWSVMTLISLGRLLQCKDISG